MPGRVLLLQGPIGPFFSLLAQELKDEGHTVFKIHFNGGDEVCYHHAGARRYRGSLADWPVYVGEFIERHHIDRVFMFGDCRSYHMAAYAVARHLDVAVFVFEEGYLRPHFVTLGIRGVNGYSSLPRNPAVFAAYSARKITEAAPAGATFWQQARCAVRYYLGAWWLRRRYPRYLHHRRLDPLREGARWLVLGGARKLRHMLFERRLSRQLERPDGDDYYLVPLQVRMDSQIVHHSRYDAVPEFIADVLASFATHAPEHTHLVFKHHPMDRPYGDYAYLIRQLAKAHGVSGRVKYLHEGHLPTLLQRALGVVVVNSTVGLSAIHHNTPVKTLGRAIYDLPGLACQRPLDVFWRNPGTVDHELYRRFRRYLIANVQGNGSFYQPHGPGVGATGIAWPLGSISAATEPGRSWAMPELPIATEPPREPDNTTADEGGTTDASNEAWDAEPSYKTGV